MTAQHDYKRSHGPVLYAAWLAFILAAYILSIGPVAWLEGRTAMIPSGFYDWFYKPLERIAANSRLVDHFFNWYEVDVWRSAHSYDHPVPTAFGL